jgi:anti-sigma-K factor RskA
MPQIYTENDLLLYHYGELSIEESQAIERELAIDRNLRNQLNGIQAAIGLIAQLEEEPSETSVALVMEYAKSVSEPSAEKV